MPYITNKTTGERREVTQEQYDQVQARKAQGVQNLAAADVDAVDLDPAQPSGASTLERVEASFNDDTFEAWKDIRGAGNVTRDERGGIFIRKDENAAWAPVEGETNWSFSEFAGDVADYGATALQDLGGSFGAGLGGAAALASGTGLVSALPAVALGGLKGRALGTAAKEGAGRMLGVIDDSPVESLKRIAIGGAEGAILEPIGLVAGEGMQKVASGAAKKLVRGVSLPEAIPIIGGSKVGLAPITKKAAARAASKFQGVNADTAEKLLGEGGEKLFNTFKKGDAPIKKVVRASLEIPENLKRKSLSNFTKKLEAEGVDFSGPADLDRLRQGYSDFGDSLNLGTELETMASAADHKFVEQELPAFLDIVKTLDGVRVAKRRVAARMQDVSDPLSNEMKRKLRGELYPLLDDVLIEGAEAQGAGLGAALKEANKELSERLNIVEDMAERFKNEDTALATIRNYYSDPKLMRQDRMEEALELEPALFEGVKEAIAGIADVSRMRVDIPKFGGTRAKAAIQGRDSTSKLEAVALEAIASPELAYPGLVAAGKTGRKIGQGIEAVGDYIGSGGKGIVRPLPRIGGGEVSRQLRGVGDMAPPPKSEDIMAKAIDLGRTNYSANYDRAKKAGTDDTTAALNAFNSLPPAKLNAAIKRLYSSELEHYRKAGINDGVARIKTIIGAE
jgi:hypothetical protein